MARTSLDWWAEVLFKPGKLEDWLKRQYQGETAPVQRLMDLQEMAINMVNLKKHEWIDLINIIIDDEHKHSKQVASLMLSRGLEPQLIPGYRARYFESFPKTTDIYELAAMGAYAEFISLTRFRAIIQHPETPLDIRHEFTSILFEEEFHYAALRRLAGPEAMDKAAIAHRRGLDAVGIE